MQKELLRLQREQGVSILFVTHSMDEALLLGDKIVILEEGRVKAEFTIKGKNEERNLLESEFLTLKKEILQKL